MNKALLIIISILITCNIKGQITKRNWMVGGNGLFSTQSENLRGTNVKGLNIEISPGIGYFFLDKFAGGARISLKYSKIEYNSVADNTTQIGFGPFLRYYILSTEKRINFFGETSFKYSNLSGNNFKSYSENTFRVSAGPVIYFNSSVGLEFTLNYEVFNSNATNTDYKTFYLGIGFQIHLESDKN